MWFEGWMIALDRKEQGHPIVKGCRAAGLFASAACMSESLRFHRAGGVTSLDRPF